MSLLTSKAVGKAVNYKKENERLNQKLAQAEADRLLEQKRVKEMRRILLSVRYKNCPDQKDRDDIDDVLRLK